MLKMLHGSLWPFIKPVSQQELCQTAVSQMTDVSRRNVSSEAAAMVCGRKLLHTCAAASGMCGHWELTDTFVVFVVSWQSKHDCVV